MYHTSFQDLWILSQRQPLDILYIADQDYTSAVILHILSDPESAYYSVL